MDFLIEIQLTHLEENNPLVCLSLKFGFYTRSSLYAFLTPHLAAQGQCSLLYLSGWSLRYLVRQKGNQSQKLSQKTSEEQNGGEPLLLILMRWMNGETKVYSI